MSSSDPRPPAEGRFLGWLTAVKGLTITNAIVIIMLALVIIPGYFVYRALNDEKLLDRFTSRFEELSGWQSPCTIRTAKQIGGPQMWAISTGFAYDGNDRWTLSVVMDHMPSPDDVHSYCETLELLVDFMRDPEARSPNFPRSERPVVKQYPRPE
jgi:hypothetical protein